MSTNPEKPNLEAALSSTPEKKSRFRPTFRSPRIPRETKLGLGIIFSLVCVFGYVLYSRLTRPTDMDPEKYVAQGESLLAPSVTSGQQSTSLQAQPNHSPTILPGNAPHNALPLTNPANNHGAASNYSAPAGGAGQTAWSPNSSNPATTGATNSDPFKNRGASTSASPEGAAANFTPNGYGTNNTASNTMPSTKQPAATTGYGLSDTTDPAVGPNHSFMPPAERATTGAGTSGTATLNAAVTQPDHATTAGSFNDPMRSATSTSPVDAFNKSATDSLNKLRQEGQDLVNSGSSAQQNLGKAADSANQLLNQTQQQLGQYTNTAGNNASSLMNQAKDASAQYGNDLKSAATQYGSDLKTSATQYGTDMKNDVQNQAGQYTNQLRNSAQDQFNQAQNQLRNSASNLVNDTTNQLNAGTQSVMTKAGESTQNLMNSASTALQPLSPLPANSAASATPSASGYGMPAAAPRTLDPTQTASQPLVNSSPSASNMNNASYSTTPAAEQPIRIPSSATLPPTTATQLNGLVSNPLSQPITGTTPNTATNQSYGNPSSTEANPNYRSAPANYGSSGYETPPTPATSGTPLQFNQPTMPAAQPTPTPVYGGATRTNFEQPASAAPTARGVQQYTVTAQDSYFSVAEKMYGNGQLNKALFEYNRRNNPAADRLQVGGAMLIPDLATLQAQYPDLVPSTAAAATANSAPTPLQFPR